MPSSVPSPSGSAERVVRLTTPPRPVTWRSWPLVDGGLKSWIWLAVIGALAWLAAWFMASNAWGAGVAAVLMLSVWRLFVPTAFELNADGLEQRVLRRWQRAPWRRFVRWESYPDGIYLFEAPARAASDLFDGIYLPLPSSRKRLREKALAAVHYHLGPPANPE